MHNYVAPCKGLQGAADHSAAIAKSTSANPHLSGVSATGFFYLHYTEQGNLSFMSHQI